MTDKLEKYYNHIEQEYSEIVGLPTLKSKSKDKWLLEAIDKFAYTYSSVWRHENLANMRYLVAVRKTDYICTIFKISRSQKLQQVTTTYAIMYSHIDPNSKIVHDYVALSPTYRSSDGEYRHRFVPVHQIQQHRKENIDMYDDVEDLVAKQAKKGQITLQTYTYFPENDNLEKKFDADLDLNRLVLIFYAAEWFLEYSRMISNRSENHIVYGYHQAMFGQLDQKIWDKYKEFLEDTSKAGNFYHKLIKIIPNLTQNTLTTELGQKLIPLTVRDIELSGDLRLAPWRETFITSRVGDLVINGITPGIPLMDDWYLLKAMHKETFDNKVSHAKINHSDVASDIIKRLEDSRRNTYIIDPVKHNEIYISYRMEGFSSAIEIPMEYAEKELVLSPYLLGLIEEHLGRTVADVPMMMMYDDYIHPMGPIFKEIKMFSKYIFEFLYTLMNLNEVFGVVHGDLHLNNCTIFETLAIFGRTIGKLNVNNPHVIYTVANKEYIFPHHGRYSALIDFSRGFIWCRKVLETEYNENQISAIKTNYKTRIMDVMLNEIPDYTTSHKDDIELALERHFESVYKVFQVLDTYKLMTGWELIIQLQILDKPERLKAYGNQQMLTDQALPLIAGIKDAAYRLFTKWMDKIISQIKLASVEVPSLNRLLLEEFFKQYQLSDFKPDPANPITLIDYWSDANTIRYNIREYEHFPPTIMFDYVRKNKIPTDQLRMESYDRHVQYLADHDPEAEVEKIADSTKASRAERRGTPGIKFKQEDKLLAENLKLQIASSDDMYFST